MRTFESKILPFINMKTFLEDSETIKLGRKSQEEEVEKFIMANTQELAKDKWLCPLSGKKFKGPDFIRKHIQTKHVEKIDEVKHAVGGATFWQFDFVNVRPSEKPDLQLAGGQA